MSVARPAAVFVLSLVVQLTVAAIAAARTGIPLSYLGLYFDGHLYIEIAKSFPLPYAPEGYAYWAQAPGYPALMALLRWVLPSALFDWGAIALLGTALPAAGSAAVFYGVCREIGLKPLVPAIAFALLNPQWIVSGASAHPEGLAMLFALLCLLAALRDRLGWAVVWLSLAGLTRYPAFMLGLPLAVDALIVRRHVRVRTFALLAAPVAVIALWSLYLHQHIPEFPGLTRSKPVPLTEHLGWPFVGLVTKALAGDFTAVGLLRLATLITYLAAVVIGLRASERRLAILPIWVATLVIFHGSFRRLLFILAFPRLVLLAWPAALAVLCRFDPIRGRARTIALLGTALATFGVWYAQERLTAAVYFQDSAPWFVKSVRPLLERDAPGWYHRPPRTRAPAAALP